MIERKSKQIDLLGESVYLFERTAGQVYAFSVYAKENKVSGSDGLMLSVGILRDALQPNIDGLKWYEIAKRRKYKKLFNVNYLFNKLTQSQLSDYITIIIEDLEGNKKKVEAEEIASI